MWRQEATKPEVVKSFTRCHLPISSYLCPCLRLLEHRFFLSLQLFWSNFFLRKLWRNNVQEGLREVVREVRGRAEGCDGWEREMRRPEGPWVLSSASSSCSDGEFCSLVENLRLCLTAGKALGCAAQFLIAIAYNSHWNQPTGNGLVITMFSYSKKNNFNPQNISSHTSHLHAWT